MEQERRWRWGVNRWFVLLFIVLGFFAARAYPPILPEILLPAEALSEHPLFTAPIIGDFYITNTFVAVILADLILIALALIIRRALAGGEMVLSGVAGAVEAVLEALYNLAESTAGKWAKTIFPWMATIILLVLVVNWMELIPGVDSVGFLHHLEEGHPVQTIAHIGDTEVQTIVADTGHEAEAAADHLYAVVPWVRVTSTDLNFTFALALISVVVTQIIGLRALGLSYFGKFFNVSTLFNRPVFGVIDFAVGILELVSELSKVLSFSFRLFGNIFAGTVLLFVIGTLVPVFAQTFILMLEFFVGLIQAVVFGLLTMIFMSQATVGHGHDDSEH